MNPGGWSQAETPLEGHSLPLPPAVVAISTTLFGDSFAIMHVAWKEARMSGKYQYLRDGQWTAHSDGVTTDTNGLGKATKSLLSIGVALAVIILLALAISNPEFALSIIAQYVSF